MAHQLRAVADAQHGNAHLEQFLADGGGVRQINTVGPAGEDDARGLFLPHGLKGFFVGYDLGIYAAFAHAAGDQLIVLTAEVHH